MYNSSRNRNFAKSNMTRMEKSVVFFSLFFKPLLDENVFYLVICSQYVWMYMMLILNDTTRPPTTCLSLFDTMM